MRLSALNDELAQVRTKKRELMVAASMIIYDRPFRCAQRLGFCRKFPLGVCE